MKFFEFVRNAIGFFMKLNPVTIIIGIVVVIVLAFAIPHYESVLSFFGYDTRAVLKDKLQQANQNTQTAVDANKAQDTAIKINEGTIKHTDEAIGQKIASDKKVDKVIKVIKGDTHEKIEKIEKSDLTPLEKRAAVDIELIDSLWTSYCSFNEDAQCKDVKIPEPQEEI
jgi:hypothetical protein